MLAATTNANSLVATRNDANDADDADDYRNEQSASGRSPIVRAGGHIERDDAEARNRRRDTHAVRPEYPFDAHRSGSKRHRGGKHGGRRRGGHSDRDRDDDRDNDEDERDENVGRAAASTDADANDYDLPPVALSRASIYGGGGAGNGGSGGDGGGGDGGGVPQPISPVLVSHGGVPQPRGGASQGGGNYVGAGDGVIASGYSATNGGPYNPLGTAGGGIIGGGSGNGGGGVGCLPSERATMRARLLKFALVCISYRSNIC